MVRYPFFYLKKTRVYFCCLRKQIENMVCTTTHRKKAKVNRFIFQNSIIFRLIKFDKKPLLALVFVK